MEKKTARANADLTYAIDVVHATCCLAGSASYLDDLARICEIVASFARSETTIPLPCSTG